jgi:N,N'-diacetyllegionaminate synthase
LNSQVERIGVFVIAEAGSNWKCGTYEEDLIRAKQLIDIAKSAGCNAVKFQTYKPETLYVPNAGQSDYLSKQGMDQKINDMFEYLSMPYEMIPELANHCSKKNIIFMSTPFSVDDAKQIDPFVEIHKVASYEINHVRLLEFLAKTGKPTFVSTGASTYDEIDFVVNLFKKNDNNMLRLMQCTSKYPCPIDALSLSVIPHLRSKYNVPVGLSDHSVDPVIGPVMAVSYGAVAIEKHFTLDKKLPGPDHPFALNPDELNMMVKSIRNAEKSIGSGVKEILEVEEELRKFAKRSIQAIKKISKGEELIEGVNIEVLRPGKKIRGLDPRFLENLRGKKAKKDIEIGDGVLDYE